MKEQLFETPLFVDSDHIFSTFELERYVLGSLLSALDKTPYEVVKAYLTPNMFSDQRHFYIYSYILNLYEKNNFKPIDLVSFIHNVRSKKEINVCGGLSYLNDISCYSFFEHQIENYCKSICKKYYIRLTNHFLMNMIDQNNWLIYPPNELIAQMIRGLEKLNNKISLNSDHLPLIIGNDLDMLLDKVKETDELVIPTGFKQLDQMLNGGLRGGKLVVVAARPGVGKSAFALKLALNAIKEERKVLFYSYEMPSNEIAQRVIAMHSRISLDKIIKNDFDYTDVKRYQGAKRDMENKLRFLLLYDILSQGRKCSAEDIAVDLSKLSVSDQKPDLLIIDQLNKMHYIGKDDIRIEFGKTTRRLKELSGQYNIPIVLLAQLKREDQSKDNKPPTKPSLERLKESGSIEEDADIVLMLWRNDSKRSYVPNEKQASLFLEKHRGGKTGVIKAVYIGEYLCWEELETQIKQDFYGKDIEF